MRNLSSVIDQMLAVIPEQDDSACAEYMRDNFECIQTSVEFAAPETIIFWWQKTGFVINTYLPIPEELNDWQKQLINIWTDRQM